MFLKNTHTSFSCIWQSLIGVNQQWLHILWNRKQQFKLLQLLHIIIIFLCVRYFKINGSECRKKVVGALLLLTWLLFRKIQQFATNDPFVCHWLNDLQSGLLPPRIFIKHCQYLKPRPHKRFSSTLISTLYKIFNQTVITK